MARVGILSPTIADGDAIGNDVAGMDRCLRSLGHDVRVFASEWTARVPKVERLDRAESLGRDRKALLLYHHSIGWGAGLALLNRARARKVVKYHNVTPPEFFRGYSRDYENACRVGRIELSMLARMGCDGYLADSEFNLSELIQAGTDPARGRVVSPFHHIDDLTAQEADLGVLDSLLDGSVNLLSVGRVCPNKGHAMMLRAFAVYRRRYNPQSRLIVVGRTDPRLGTYQRELDALAARLGVGSSVRFTGGVPPPVLKAYYLAARALVVTSEHEGFCVPIVEAMALRLPVVALAAAAVPGTIGGAGLVWEERDPEILAASIDRVVRDEEVRRGLEDLGRARYESSFSNERVEEALGRTLAPWLEG